MAIGDPNFWVSRFTSVDERLLNRIAAVWPKCTARFSAQPEEDQITINLIDILLKDEFVRSICYWIEYQFEPFGIAANGARFSKGIIDMAVLLDWDREHYVAYECKRLNVSYKGSRQSLATRYVNEGASKFVTEQYADGLPIGCMLGYVIDGDMRFAATQVAAAITANGASIRLQGDLSALPTIGIVERFMSTHLRGATSVPIEVRHALLPFV